jgi:hypothetical protein
MSRNVVEGQGCRLTIRRRNVPVPSLIAVPRFLQMKGQKGYTERSVWMQGTEG